MTGSQGRWYAQPRLQSVEIPRLHGAHRETGLSQMGDPAVAASAIWILMNRDDLCSHWMAHRKGRGASYKDNSPAPRERDIIGHKSCLLARVALIGRKVSPARVLHPTSLASRVIPFDGGVEKVSGVKHAHVAIVDRYSWRHRIFGAVDRP